MKERPNGFLSKKNIDHDGEIFDYIKELHEYLWFYIRKEHPGASGNINNWLSFELSDAPENNHR